MGYSDCRGKYLVTAFYGKIVKVTDNTGICKYYLKMLSISRYLRYSNPPLFAGVMFQKLCCGVLVQKCLQMLLYS